SQLASGQFHSGAHETSGMAAVFQLAGGKKTLRLTNFQTSNGPDVHVYLVAAADAKDNDTVTKAEVVDLGSLKGNIGDQNYDLPANADLAKYRAVTIWCKRFSVNFGTAPLNSSMQSMNVQELPESTMPSNNHYDVIINGTGAGGGTLAYKLAPSGKKILLLERGDYVPREKDNWSTRAVNLDGKYNTKEAWRDSDGKELHPHTNYFVGGNTKFYGAALFRLRREDFGEIRHHGG